MNLAQMIPKAAKYVATTLRKCTEIGALDDLAPKWRELRRHAALQLKDWQSCLMIKIGIKIALFEFLNELLNPLFTESYTEIHSLGARRVCCDNKRNNRDNE